MPSLSYISYLKGFPSIVNVSGLHNHSSKSLELPMQIVQISKTKLKSFHTLTTSSFGKTSLSAKHANIRSSGASGGTCALRLNNDMNSHCKAVDSTCWWKYHCCPSLRLQQLTFKRDKKKKDLSIYNVLVGVAWHFYWIWHLNLLGSDLTGVKLHCLYCTEFPTYGDMAQIMMWYLLFIINYCKCRLWVFVYTCVGRNIGPNSKIIQIKNIPLATQPMKTVSEAYYFSLFCEDWIVLLS